MRASRDNLERALRAQHDKLLVLEGNLFHAGFPEQASRVQWACLQVWQATVEMSKEGNKKHGVVGYPRPT